MCEFRNFDKFLRPKGFSLFAGLVEFIGRL